MEAMKPPMYVGHLPSDEQQRLEKGLRSRDAFELRRCQILLASARGGRPSQIAAHLGCTPQTVRNTIRAYWADATRCLRARSSRRGLFSKGTILVAFAVPIAAEPETILHV